jgi:hypothetical protein
VLEENHTIVQVQGQLAEAGWDVPSHQAGAAEQQYNTLLCPHCQGGDSGEHNASLAIKKRDDGGWIAVYTCWRKNNCGVSGSVPSPRVRRCPAVPRCIWS